MVFPHKYAFMLHFKHTLPSVTNNIIAYGIFYFLVDLYVLNSTQHRRNFTCDKLRRYAVEKWVKGLVLRTVLWYEWLSLLVAYLSPRSGKVKQRGSLWVREDPTWQLPRYSLPPCIWNTFKLSIRYLAEFMFDFCLQCEGLLARSNIKWVFPFSHLVRVLPLFLVRVI